MNTMMTNDPEKFLEQRQKYVDALLNLWSRSMPGQHLPSESNFSSWFDTFGWDVMRQAIARTANKSRKQERQRCPMNGSDLERYCTGTARRMAVEVGIWK